MKDVETFHLKEFSITDIGDCEIQVFKENTSSPMAHVVKDDDNIICSLNLSTGESIENTSLNDIQKKEINDAIKSKRTVAFTNIDVDVWKDMCILWSDLNDPSETVQLPKEPLTYFG